METIIYILFALVIGFIAGKIYSYFKNRIQCLNCGSSKTKIVGSMYGSGNGEYQYAVKTWESHLCSNCKKMTNIKMKLYKD